MSLKAKKTTFRIRRGDTLRHLTATIFHFDKRSQKGQEIAEFSTVLLLLFLVLFFPFVDMILYFASYGAIYLTCNLAARAAAPTFTNAAAVTAVTNLFSNPFIKGLQSAAKVTPTGATDSFSPGYHLSVLQGSSSSASLASATPGSVTLPVPSGTLYLYEESAEMTLSPLFPLPLIGGGQPVSFHATCFIEHPEGLNTTP